MIHSAIALTNTSAAGPGTGTASVAGLATNVNAVDVRTVAYNAGGNPVNENGFSDHFPIGMRVTEAD